MMRRKARRQASRPGQSAPEPSPIGRIKAERDGTMLRDAAHLMMVAYSTFPQPFRPNPKIMSQPLEMPSMSGSFVACVLEEQSGSSIPRAAIIFKADIDFGCPQMPEFILKLIDTVDVIRKLSRRSNARVVASQFVLKEPLAVLDREKCQEIFDWQYLGYSQSNDLRLI